MRRTYNSNMTENRGVDCLDVTRRLYSGITDIAKRLDVQKSCAEAAKDIFTIEGEILRGKLKHYCEKLIFKDPLGHARKIEELLWRKGFYDAVSAAKQLRKGNVWSETEKALLSAHLSTGVGFYHHFIFKIQLEYDLNLSGVLDFAYSNNQSTLSTEKSKSHRKKPLSDEIRQCAVRMIHRSLVCLGDLARYSLDLDPTWDPLISTRYYKIAITIDPNIGMPHNQLGTVAGSKNHGLDAIYHYMRAVLCSETFEGADGNLKRMFNAHSHTGKEQSPVHKCTSKLFSLLKLWESDSPDAERINRDCQNLLVEFENCLSQEKPESLKASNIENEDTIDSYLQSCKNDEISYLSDDVMFKIVSVCLMSIGKLKAKESGEVQGAVAFTLTILSQLMQVTIARLQNAVIEKSLPNGIIDVELESTGKQLENDEAIETNSNGLNAIKEELPIKNGQVNGVGFVTMKSREKSKSLLTKLRRPRKRLNSSDSDASDTRVCTSSDEMNSDISETDEEDAISDAALSDDLSDDENVKDTSITLDKTNGHDVDVNDTENTAISESDKNDKEIDKNNEVVEKNGIRNSGSPVTNGNASDEGSEMANDIDNLAQMKKENLDMKQLLDILGETGRLETIKICFDWLRVNPEIFKMFARSSKASLQRVTTLLNLVNLTDLEGFLGKNERFSVLTSSMAKLKESKKIVPLPEDFELRGLKLLEEAHKILDWGVLRHTRVTKDEETLLRALKLMNFGHYLCSVAESGIKYDSGKKVFVTSELNKTSLGRVNGKKNGKDETIAKNKGLLMRNMGKLWLRAEVRALESRLKSPHVSPYLVPDQEALAKHTPALKRLVHAKRFIIIIPSVVVSALDEMKRTSSKAREATRWLEGQLKKGSRFLRAQRPQERLHLPLIKGPKPKDKEAWLFFHIIECCHYLTQQTKVGLNGDKEPPVVTLLTGLSSEERKSSSFNTDVLAKTAGVNIEHIEAFHMKWKTSSKSHG